MLHAPLEVGSTGGQYVHVPCRPRGLKHGRRYPGPARGLEVRRRRRTTMEGQRIVFVAPRQARLESFEVPRPGPGQVLVRTTRTLVSAGTELKAYLGSEHGAGARYPRMPGYSHVGVVEDVGGGVASVRPG